jgi:peptide/nickel transport system substrate-binding protein
MFRPLFWFGLGASAAEQPSLSIGGTPKYSNGNKTVAITLKSWKFANGEAVNAASVKFFLDMYKADPTGAASAGNANGGGYCGYNGGYGIPDQLTNVVASGQKVTLTFNTSINPYWDLYNNLSQITPMAASWDITHNGGAPGSGDCATDAYGSNAAKTACVNVENYLDTESGNTNTYAGALWQGGDDGPWKLTSFDNLGNATFVPNTKYDGPQKAKVAHFDERAYASTSAEETALSTNSIQLGFLDPTAIECCASGGHAGPNPAVYNSHYKLVTGPEWGFNYAVYNLGASDPNHAELDQLYVRQALQEGVDQPDIIHAIDKGYGTVTSSPLPNPLPSSLGHAPSAPYPSSSTSWQTGKQDLANHGWTFPGGTATCTSPGTGAGECGAGINNGDTLNYNLLEIQASQCPSCADTYNAEISNWAKEGISINVQTGTFNDIISDCGTGGTFQICTWGGGWIYAPDFEPTGESLFASTGGFNIGSYDDSHMDALIHATDFGTANLTAFGLYAAQQLPVLYEPTGQGTGEVSRQLKGVQPPNPLGNLMPEYLSY